MKILYLTYFLRWAGLERQLSYLAGELARMGHEVHVAYLSIGHEGGRGDLRQVHCHEIAKTGHYDPLIIWRLVRLIRSIRPDVIQTWHYLMDVFGGLASTLTRTPWVLRAPLPDTDEGGWRKRARIWSRALPAGLSQIRERANATGWRIARRSRARSFPTESRLAKSKMLLLARRPFPQTAGRFYTSANCFLAKESAT